MEGLVEEGSDVIEEDFEGAVKDAALIGAAQRVEHYEIAAYGTVCAFAERPGESEQVELLSETLEEEKQTDEKLTKLAEQINRKPAQVSRTKAVTIRSLKIRRNPDARPKSPNFNSPWQRQGHFLLQCT
jgi:ferritin-like metal-binding protein YciE